MDQDGRRCTESVACRSGVVLVTPGGGITAWPTPASAADFPGVSVSDFTRMIPAGDDTGTPLAPTANMYSAPNGGAIAPGAPSLVAGVASGAGVQYIAALGFMCWAVGGPAGASEATLTMKFPRMCVPDGPWRSVALATPEPSVAVVGFRQCVVHAANPAAGLAIGCGWVVGGEPLTAGNNWLGGPLAVGDNDLMFPGGTRPNVCLIKLNAGAYQVRVRGNDGVSRLYALAQSIDPLLPHVVDFRVYRATLLSPARYALYINAVLQWSQLMSDGASGGESASPTATNVAVMPFVSSQGQGGPGIRVWDFVAYRGYDLTTTTDRG